MKTNLWTKTISLGIFKEKLNKIICPTPKQVFGIHGLPLIGSKMHRNTVNAFSFELDCGMVYFK